MRTGERGSGTVLAAAGALLAGVVAVVVVLVGSVVVAGQQLRRTADLVAVSAATAGSVGEDPCSAAERLAAANGVALDSCAAQGDFLDFAVTVVVSRPLGLPVAGLDHRPVATANAGWLSTPG